MKAGKPKEKKRRAGTGRATGAPAGIRPATADGAEEERAMHASFASLVTFDALFVMFCGQHLVRPAVDMKVRDGDGERVVKAVFQVIAPVEMCTSKWVLVVEVTEDPAGKLVGTVLKGVT